MTLQERQEVERTFYYYVDEFHQFQYSGIQRPWEMYSFYSKNIKLTDFGRYWITII